jgi:hypothetical protein
MSVTCLNASETSMQTNGARCAERPGPLPPLGFVSVGELDVELRERTTIYDRDVGRRLLVRVLHLPAGPFDPSTVCGRGWLGLLVLDGLLLVQLEEGRGHVGWLAGESDLLRPW